MPTRALWLAAGTAALACPALAASIYTCTDAQGRYRTADRPIPECLDREQRELGPNGNVKRIIARPLTAEERAQAEAQRQAQARQQAEAQERRRQERALLARYPTPASHEQARTAALEQWQTLMQGLEQHHEALAKQQREVEAEMEFYQHNPKQAPAWLQQRQRDNREQRDKLTLQLEQQAQEKQQIQARFDAELEQLRRLWANTPSQQN